MRLLAPDGPRYTYGQPHGNPPEPAIAHLHWLLVPPALLVVWAGLVSIVGASVQAADTGVPVRFDTRWFGLVSREMGARVLFVLAAPLAWWRPGAWLGDGNLGPPVLLLAGANAGRASLIPLAVFLGRRGWRWVWPVARRSPDTTLLEEADHVVRSVGRLRDVTGSHEVDIVAFGTAGLVVAQAFRDRSLGGVRRVVTLGTPWNGTKMAVFGRRRLAADVGHGSHLLEGLTPLPVPLVCVWSSSDPMVVPAKSAHPPHGADGVCIDGAGHLDLLLSARVWRTVQAALLQPVTAGLGHG
jgi:hypothetical protein